MRGLIQSYRLKQKIARDFAFRHDFGARNFETNTQGSGFGARSRLYPGRSCVVSDLGRALR